MKVLYNVLLVDCICIYICMWCSWVRLTKLAPSGESEDIFSASGRAVTSSVAVDVAAEAAAIERFCRRKPAADWRNGLYFIMSAGLAGPKIKPCDKRCNWIASNPPAFPPASSWDLSTCTWRVLEMISSSVKWKDHEMIIRTGGESGPLTIVVNRQKARCAVNISRIWVLGRCRNATLSTYFSHDSFFRFAVSTHWRDEIV